jgi:hypothetical protein
MISTRAIPSASSVALEVESMRCRSVGEWASGLEQRAFYHR